MSIVATMNPEPVPQPPMDAETKSRLNSVPAWGSYLYQNFLLPAISPTASMSEWLNLNTPFAALTPRAGAQQQQQQQQQPQAPVDYFGGGWVNVKQEEGVMPAPNPTPMPNYNQARSQVPPPNFSNFAFTQPPPSAPMQQSASHPSFSRNSDAGPSSYYAQQYFPHLNLNASSISTSLLMNQHPGLVNSAHPMPERPSHPYSQQSSSERISLPPSRNSLNIVDGQLTHSPSPMNSRSHTPHQSPKRAGKRRFDSLDSEELQEHEHDSEHEPDVPEGVERDGMIWGMQVDAYRALSARERKRVRNRISARTFRAKRKEHLSLLEESSTAKDLKIKLAAEENTRLQLEVAELRRRLAKYE